MTPTQEAAMQQALEALEYHVEQTRPIWKTSEAIAALEAALAEPVQEPVAMKTHGAWDGLELLDGLPDGTCLYTSPPQRKPLTEEEILSLFRTSGSPTAFARAVERAYGIV